MGQNIGASVCNHETCPYCHRLVAPVVNTSLYFTTKVCPFCYNTISDIAKPTVDRREARLAQEEQYLTRAWDAESRGNIALRDSLLAWAEERRQAAGRD